MKRRVRGVGTGTVSLIMIFSVLCLTVFAILTLSTSNAEKILAERSASFVKGYYEADSLATEIRAQIIDSYAKGAFLKSAADIEITYEQEGGITIASYACRVNDVQDLLVKLKLDKSSGSILEWKTGYSQNWEADGTITIWNGEFE